MKPYSSLFILALLAMACQQEVFDPVPSSSIEDTFLATDWNENPAQPRPAGFSLQLPPDEEALLFVDRESEYTVVFGIDPSASCAAISRPDAVASRPTEELEFLEDPTSLSSAHPQHIFVTLHDQAYAPDEAWCDFVKASSILGSGLIEFEGVVAEVSCNGVKCTHATHAMHFSATGTLTRADGSPLSLAVWYQGTWPVDSPEYPSIEEEIRVRVE